MQKLVSDKSSPTVFFYGTKKDIGSGAFVYAPISVLDVSMDTHDGAATFLFRQKSEMSHRGGVTPPFFRGVPIKMNRSPRLRKLGGSTSYML